MQKKLFRALVRLLPKEIRSLYGEEMETTFETERRAEEVRGGARAVLRLWIETVLDVLRTAPSEHLDMLQRDTRYALRTMSARRTETVTAVVTLALAIGANVAMFAVVDAVLLSPLPYDSAENLVTVSETAGGEEPSNLGYLTFVDLRDRSRSFDSLVAATMSTATLTEGERPAERVNAMRASRDYFEMIGVHPALGRGFTEEEDRPGAARRVVVLSHGLWQRRFDGDAAVVGAVIDISGREYRVVGVMPAGFEDLVAQRLFDGAELWYPLGYDATASFACRDCRHLRVFGRLAAGVEPAAAERELSSLFATLEAEHPSDYHAPGARVQRLSDVFLGPVRTVLVMLWVGVGVLLLIACANVANLLLLRASEREHEVAVRVALGVTGARLVRQLLTESVLLSLLGGAAGLLPAWAAVRLLAVAGPSELPRLASISLDARAVVVAVTLTLASGLVFGLVPLRHLLKRNVGGAMHGSGRHSESVETWRVRSVLLAASVAMALLLLVGSGLLVRSLSSLLQVQPGFDSSGVVTMRLWAGGPRFRKGETSDQITTAVGFYGEVRSRLEALPGVVAAGAVTTLPLGGGVDGYSIHVGGEAPTDDASQAPSADRFAVTPGFFPVLRIALDRGRLLDERDRQDGEPVVVINRTAAAELFAGADPIGQLVRLGPSNAQQRRIVGVVADVRHHGLEAPVGYQVYVPQAQWPWAETAMTLVIRAVGDPDSLIAPARELIRSIDPAQPISHVQRYEDVLAEVTGTRRFAAGLLSLFAGSALALSLVGLYSAVGVVVGQRRYELGLRLALGARAKAIRRMVLVQGMRPVVLGLLVGLVAATASVRALRSLPFEVHALDPAVFSGAVGVLLLTGAAACWLPAWRASRIDPSTTLRTE